MKNEIKAILDKIKRLLDEEQEAQNELVNIYLAQKAAKYEVVWENDGSMTANDEKYEPLLQGAYKIHLAELKMDGNLSISIKWNRKEIGNGSIIVKFLNFCLWTRAGRTETYGWAYRIAVEKKVFVELYEGTRLDGFFTPSGKYFWREDESFRELTRL